MAVPQASLEIIFVRHTAVEVPLGSCYGQKDVPLQKTFKSEASKIVRTLSQRGPWDAVITSPLSRCKDLAQFLAGCEVPDDGRGSKKSVAMTFPVSYREDARLMELDFGTWEGRLWDELDPKELSPWMEDFVNQSPPRGESFRELAQRAYLGLTGIQDLAETNLHWRRILVVTHAGVIRALLCNLLQIPLEKAFQLVLDYGSMSGVELTGQHLRCAYINRVPEGGQDF